MNISITKLDAKHFPISCCGEEYGNAREFMDHFLPTHEANSTLVNRLRERAADVAPRRGLARYGSLSAQITADLLSEAADALDGTDDRQEQIDEWAEKTAKEIMLTPRQAAALAGHTVSSTPTPKIGNSTTTWSDLPKLYPSRPNPTIIEQGAPTWPLVLLAVTMLALLVVGLVW